MVTTKYLAFTAPVTLRAWLWCAGGVGDPGDPVGMAAGASPHGIFAAACLGDRRADTGLYSGECAAPVARSDLCAAVHPGDYGTAAVDNRVATVAPSGNDDLAAGGGGDICADAAHDVLVAVLDGNCGTIAWAKQPPV